MPRKRSIILIMIIALLLTSCTKKPETDDGKSSDNMESKEKEDDDMDDLEEDDEEEEKDNKDDNTTTNIAFEDIKTKPEEAYKTFNEKFPKVKIRSIKLESENSSYYYELEGYDDSYQYKLKINPIDGKVLKEIKDSNDDKPVEVSLEDIKKIEELIEKSTKDAGEDFKVDEWEIKSSDGRLLLEIELKDKNKKEKEYKYDLKTGELIEKD